MALRCTHPSTCGLCPLSQVSQERPKIVVRELPHKREQETDRATTGEKILVPGDMQISTYECNILIILV